MKMKSEIKVHKLSDNIRVIIPKLDGAEKKIGRSIALLKDAERLGAAADTACITLLESVTNDITEAVKAIKGIRATPDG